ncbi:50S ribosomal protein L24 [Candidatus Woesearchaeota archaeon]|nr:50S ribosomal protein L24 [Candidatus Woesearchaeota archaeon]
MKTKFNKKWESSKQPRKQRKYRYNAPAHIKSNLIRSHLSKELRQKYKKRSSRVIKGDKVKIMRGQFKGKTGKIEKIDVKNERIFISQIEIQKKDGSKSFYPIHPSNLLIVDLNLKDKKRQKSLTRKS